LFGLFTYYLEMDTCQLSLLVPRELDQASHLAILFYSSTTIDQEMSPLDIHSTHQLFYSKYIGMATYKRIWVAVTTSMEDVYENIGCKYL